MIDTHFHLWRRAEANQTGILAAPYLERDVRWDQFVAAWDGLPMGQAVNVQINDFVEALWRPVGSPPRRTLSSLAA